MATTAEALKQAILDRLNDLAFTTGGGRPLNR